ncbi:MAG TPA: hypothetical protein VF928_01680 [Usitatibacteraceae bacterium]
MQHRTFLEYRRYRYLKIALLLVIASIVAYSIHSSPVGRYGGSPVGYVLGSIAAALIVALMWLGVQKRRYRANVGGLRGWVSAHVYLGTSLIVIATLHAGFQIGWNVHTLAYALMIMVIVSGFFGVYAYLRFPSLMTENMGEDTRDGLILKIADLDRELRRVALSLPDEFVKIVEASVRDTRIGGSVLTQLSRRPANCPTQRAVAFINAAGKTLKGEAQQQNHALYALMLRKQKLVKRARDDVRFKALLDLWLYAHVPLSFALLGALLAHIVAVFFYW